MRRIKAIVPIISGIVLCFIGFFRSCIPYLNLGFQPTLFSLLLSDICAIVIVIIALTYKTAHIWERLFRALTQLVVYLAIWIMGVYSQIWRRIYQAITLHSSASADNISGLLWIIFTILVVVLSLAVLIVQLVYNIVKVAKEKKKTGDRGTAMSQEGEDDEKVCI